MDRRHHARSIGVLVVSNLLGGVGVAAGIAAGGLLAQAVAGTAWAGLAQAASTLGAGIAAVPLATLATRRGRRTSLSRGYVLATIGALLVVAGGVLGQLLLLLPGMGLFGVAQAVNLQTRYAAAENVSVASRARGMSLVLWATTIGSVAGPNLLAPGDTAGLALGLPALTGSFLFSVVAFAAAATVIALLFRPTPPDDPVPGEPVAGEHTADEAADPATTPRVLGAAGALRWAMGHPVARFAVVLVAMAHAVMVMVMVMTPVHMEGHGDTLELVGFVISMHVLGMYGLSPVFGWAIDRFGALRVAAVGMGIEAVSLVVGFLATGGSASLTIVALTLLGLGWSGCVLAGSTLIATVVPEHVRVPLQGASDAGMNYAGAAAAALAGPILAWSGFHGVNAAAALVLLPAILLLRPAGRAMSDHLSPSPSTT